MSGLEPSYLSLLMTLPIIKCTVNGAKLDLMQQPALLRPRLPAGVSLRLVQLAYGSWKPARNGVEP